jgi:hypothetical protein
MRQYNGGTTVYFLNRQSGPKQMRFRGLLGGFTLYHHCIKKDYSCANIAYKILARMRGNKNKIFTEKRRVQIVNIPRSPWSHSCAQQLLAS